MWYSPLQQRFSDSRPMIARARPFALLLAILASAVPRLPGADAASFGADLKPLLENLCYSCHDARKHKAGIDLSAYHDESAVHKDVATWRKVANQIDSRDMPPEDATVQPSDAQRQLLVSWIRTSEARALVGQPRDPGASPPRRLNRA